MEFHFDKALYQSILKIYNDCGTKFIEKTEEEKKIIDDILKAIEIYDNNSKNKPGGTRYKNNFTKFCRIYYSVLDQLKEIERINNNYVREIGMSYNTTDKILKSLQMENGITSPRKWNSILYKK